MGKTEHGANRAWGMGHGAWAWAKQAKQGMGQTGHW